MTSLFDPAERIKSFVCGLASPRRESRLLFMLVAYVDDSGSDENDHAFVLAGFVSTSDAWVRFSDEWDELCRQPPQTLDFKMKIAERLKGIDTYWGDGTEEELIVRRDTKVQALAEVIQRHAICRVSAGLDWHNYRAIVRDMVPQEVDNPYFFLFWELVMAVVSHQERTDVREKVDFIFDDQGPIGRTAVSWHDRFIATLSPFARYIISGTPRFESDTDVLPLKAADMLAWQMRRYVEDQGKDRENISKTQMRPALETLISLPHIQGNIDAERLRWIVKEVNHVETAK